MSNLNFAEEMNRFNKIWRADRRRYIAAGMSEDSITEMFDLHREQFNSDRRHRTHNQSMDNSVFSDGDKTGEDRSPLLEKYLHQLSSCQPEISEWGRYGWIEDLDSPELAQLIRSLSTASIDILTCMVVDGMSRADLSREMNLSRAAVTKRVNPIKDRLKALCK